MIITSYMTDNFINIQKFYVCEAGASIHISDWGGGGGGRRQVSQPLPKISASFARKIAMKIWRVETVENLTLCISFVLSLC